MSNIKLMSTTTKTILVKLLLKGPATTEELLGEFRKSKHLNGKPRSNNWGGSLLAHPESRSWGSKCSLLRRGIVRCIGSLANGNRMFELTTEGKKLAKQVITSIK